MQAWRLPARRIAQKKTGLLAGAPECGRVKASAFNGNISVVFNFLGFFLRDGDFQDTVFIF